MLKFYRKAIVTFLGFVALTALLAYICFEMVFVSDALLPADESIFKWKSETLTDVPDGGSSSVAITEDIFSFDFEYYLTKAIQYPHVFAVVAFSGPESAKHLVDLNKYSTSTFKVKCSTHNALAFYVHSFDERVTDPADFNSYRIASALFSCHDDWSKVEIDLKHLKVPRWWLDMEHVDISDQNYCMDKVIAISFVGSWQGPVKTLVKVKISELTLHGRDWRYAWAFAGFLAIMWIGYISWLLKQYTQSLVADVKNRLKKDRPLIAYQQLSIKPHRDKEKSEVLRFMATEYKNPDMSLEFAVSALGINRTKINELLKDELGMTFSTYLNKLRLAEAARLLSQQDEANVAEIAHLVGYSNVSYFNKLFKNEYDCTPKTFIDIHGSKS